MPLWSVTEISFVEVIIVCSYDLTEDTRPL
jgi:hypothetical protein